MSEERMTRGNEYPSEDMAEAAVLVDLITRFMAKASFASDDTLRAFEEELGCDPKSYDDKDEGFIRQSIAYARQWLIEAQLGEGTKEESEAARAFESRWVVRGVKRWDNDATTEVPVNSPESSTVYICQLIEVDGKKRAGGIVWMANCDRHGWVDLARGEAEYRQTVKNAWDIVRWHNKQVGRGR